jgi:hypothetical protein
MAVRYRLVTYHWIDGWLDPRQNKQTKQEVNASLSLQISSIQLSVNHHTAAFGIVPVLACRQHL